MSWAVARLVEEEAVVEEAVDLEALVLCSVGQVEAEAACITGIAADRLASQVLQAVEAVTGLHLVLGQLLPQLQAGIILAPLIHILQLHTTPVE